ncbi:M4 family metallopeptidase [Salinibacterium sp. dk2585]|uniref:M4 family metallopeptidase n=1 Tax=unclassified Salinibacterium TaxID=2632331 RepID=UPI0011C249B3|nr:MULTISPECIES: M4 family metallopeptidase [unclassified Salinibacterium]QEE61680.1 M4 family metallopeptidase [Salinibacterium sp. dk2585]TXK54768.1 M4 family metallopeptidase [Salinibacterium sp. dk5596]
MRCPVVPPYLLARIAKSDDPRYAAASESARRSLLVDGPVRRQRCEVPASTDTQAPSPGMHGIAAPRRTIYDAERTTTLPGRVVREEGDPPSGDAAVDEAHEGLGHTHRMFLDAFGRASIDDHNMRLDAVVHYGDRYDNAFWDGSRMVFGDGDGQVFESFTRSLTVIGHELAHGVTQHAAGLEYQGQSGALAESVSDVFGALVEQYALGQGSDEASWLIGAGLFTPLVQGRALRSMLEPGTAFDDDVIGRDPQPAHMRDYIVTNDDNGGVHLNSGIPNRAFALAAIAIGGNAWERAGQVWYDTLTSGRLSRTVTFPVFATATVDAAGARYGADSPETRAVREGWNTVGVPL